MKGKQMAVEKKLFDKVGMFWNKNQKMGVEGLSLLNECIQRVASVDCDKDALTRFISRSGMDQAKVSRIIRAAFGADLVYKKDALKAAGGVLSHKWHGPDGYVLKNTYSHVLSAIDDKKSFNDKDLQKTIKPEKVEKVRDKAEILAAFKTRALKLAKEEGLTVAMMVAALQSKEAVS